MFGFSLFKLRKTITLNIFGTVGCRMYDFTKRDLLKAPVFQFLFAESFSMAFDARKKLQRKLALNFLVVNSLQNSLKNSRCALLT